MINDYYDFSIPKISWPKISLAAILLAIIISGFLLNQLLMWRLFSSGGLKDVLPTISITITKKG